MRKKSATGKKSKQKACAPCAAVKERCSLSGAKPDAAKRKPAAKDAQRGAFDPTFVAVRSPAFDAHIPGAYPETPRGETTGAGGVSMSEGAPTTASTLTQPATALAAGSVPKGVVDTVPFDTRESMPPISVSVPASFPRN